MANGLTVVSLGTFLANASAGAAISTLQNGPDARDWPNRLLVQVSTGAGSPAGTMGIQLQGSLDGVTYANLGSAINALGISVIDFPPPPFIRVGSTGSITGTDASVVVRVAY